MKLFTLSLIGATVGLALSGAANAAILTYNFGSGSVLGTGNLGATASMTVGGIDLTIEAYKHSPSDLAGAIHRNGTTGLGVVGNPNGRRIGRNGTFTEAIRFDFGSTDVKLIDTIIFERGGLNGSFDYFVDGSFVETISWGAGGGTFFTHSLSAEEGSIFEFRANTRRFRITEIRAKHDAQTVSEPGMLALFGLGLAGLGYVRRRRSA